MKLKLLLILLALPFFGNAQMQNLRKAILKSDLIISINNYRIDTIHINDFTSKQYINIDKINEENSRIYKNNLGSVPKKLSLRKLEDGEDFYSDDNINQSCACAIKALEQGKVYSDLFFIKKEKNEYQIVANFQNLEWEQLQKFEQQIKSLASVEKMKDEKERYQKSLDWFIVNGLMPDEDFVDYYTEKHLIKDSVKYSENQYTKALQEFESGKEELLPMVREKYFDKVKVYYLQKMEDILKLPKRDYENYYDFVDLVNNITNTFNSNSESADYIMNYALNNDKFEEYEKHHIMQHLIEVVKNWELNEE